MAKKKKESFSLYIVKYNEIIVVKNNFVEVPTVGNLDFCTLFRSLDKIKK